MSLVCGNCGEQILNSENCPSCVQRKFMEIVEDSVRVGETIKGRRIKEVSLKERV
jgi:ribosomal protein L32